MPRFLRSSAFWLPFSVSLIVTGGFFLWELGYLPALPYIPRPPAQSWEKVFTAALVLLLSLNSGLIVWQRKYGSCPFGVKSASGVAGVMGALTLICPACILLPASLIGVGFFFVFIAPFLPLLRLVSVVLLVISTAMLWPRK